MKKLAENKKLGKEQRLQVYKKALEIHQKLPRCGLCFCLLHAQDELFNVIYTDAYRKMNLFPEIIKHEPKDYFVYWFPLDEKGIIKRTDILENAIIELS